MALAMKNVKVPAAVMNIIPMDFFSLQPQQEVLAPYKMRTTAGEEVERKFIVPKIDAVVGNPLTRDGLRSPMKPRS